jgi:hypothetical protein
MLINKQQITEFLIVIIKKLGFNFLPFFLYSIVSFGNGEIHPAFNQVIYLGLIGGYGSTTWEGLVPNKAKQNSALNLSTPIKVNEGGAVWGIFGGYEFIPAFAVELSYMNFPKAKVFFDPMSLFSFENNDKLSFLTKTDSLNLMAKVMLSILKTSFKFYSSAGVAGLHRHDLLANHWRLSPSFGVGINYPLGKHCMAEIGGNYTAGYGESQLSPTDSFYPFLYSITARLAYRF